MKKLVYLIVLSTALLSASCSKKPLCCVMPQPVIMTAQKNGVAWQMPIIKSTRSSSNLIFISTVGPQLLTTAKDSLAINLQYTGVGTYTPTDANVTYTVFANDVKTTYVLDQTYENKINITEFEIQRNEATTNPDPTEMKATFNLRFTDPEHTTTVTLLNGKFTAYLGLGN
ncbi:MAG TPA: hypothetical protein VJ844_08835 [Mucilaginibacter sp.]|nr:hypothetical protein [Mucilaginibacter sp.]